MLSWYGIQWGSYEERYRGRPRLPIESIFQTICLSVCMPVPSHEIPFQFCFAPPPLQKCKKVLQSLWTFVHFWRGVRFGHKVSEHVFSSSFSISKQVGGRGASTAENMYINAFKNIHNIFITNLQFIITIFPDP